MINTTGPGFFSLKKGIILPRDYNLVSAFNPKNICGFPQTI